MTRRRAISYSVPAAMLIAFMFMAAPALAASPTGYGTSAKARWNGLLRAVDAASGAPLDSAHIITRNIPLNSRVLVFRILMGDGGRSYSECDSAGFGYSQVRPLGSVVVWKRGYWAEKLEWKLLDVDTDVILAETGVITFALRPVAAAERKAAALDLVEKLGASTGLVRKWVEYPLMNPLRAVLGRFILEEIDATEKEKTSGGRHDEEIR